MTRYKQRHSLNRGLQMIRTVEATIDANGHIHIAKPIKLKGLRRALVTIFEEPPIESIETAMLSEDSLATDWSRQEEDQAWSHLQ